MRHPIKLHSKLFKMLRSKVIILYNLHKTLTNNSFQKINSTQIQTKLTVNLHHKVVIIRTPFFYVAQGH